MEKKIVILTGASRGLGLAMARQLLQSGHSLLTMSRKRSQELQDCAEQSNAALTQWQINLNEAVLVSHKLQEWLQALNSHPLRSISLINNAGVIPQIASLRDVQARDLSNALRVGLEACVLLTSAFLSATRDFQCQRRVLNISSGLGRRPMASQAAYCATKAGMDLFTRCVALEESEQQNGARLCALAPGVIDTDMQVQMRAAQDSDFPDVERFRQLEKQDALSSPAAAAEKILAYLEHPDFGTQVIADIREINI